MIVAVVTLVLFTPMPSQATTLVEGGNTTYDPSTGLRWLDVGITTGRSYNDVLSNLNNPSDVVYGYRFATGNEIGQLFIDAGLYEFPYGGGFCDPCSDALSNSEISHLITLLGPTFSSEIGQPNLQYILGFNADIYQSSYQYLSLLAYYAPTYALAIVPKDFLSPNSSRSDIGSFLVEVSPTPLPATLPLFATGLSVMGLLSWRRKKRAAIAAI
jgi:hypothetical protein